MPDIPINYFVASNISLCFSVGVGVIFQEKKRRDSPAILVRSCARSTHHTLSPFSYHPAAPKSPLFFCTSTGKDSLSFGGLIMLAFSEFLSLKVDEGHPSFVELDLSGRKLGGFTFRSINLLFFNHQTNFQK